MQIQTVADLIARNERYYPRTEAYVSDARRVTFRDYADRCRRLASALHDFGVAQQDRVGILSTNNVEYFELYGACEWAGFISAHYNFRSAAPEIAHLLKVSSPRVVVFEAKFASLIGPIRKDFPEVRAWIGIGGGSDLEGVLDFEDLVAQGKPEGPPFRASPGDIAYLFFTSGTTGRPKGVPWTQAGAVEIARTQGRMMGPDLRLLQITPAFHVGGKGFALGAHWMSGTVVVAPAFDPLQFLETVQRERVTYTFMVGPMIQAVLDHPRFAEFDRSSLRSIMSASAPIAAPLLVRAIEQFGPVFFISYGSTECGNVALLEKHELQPAGTPQDVERLLSIGHFNPETPAVLLDDALNESPPRVVGEICVKSPVFAGYWNDDDATREATRGGWFHTGDLAYQDEEGFVFIVDRKKDMIISGGENIYSREVEDALSRHPAVMNAAVIGVPDPKWGEAVKAIVVLRPGMAATQDELVAHCRTQIARYKCPRSVELVAELPLLGTGKVDKVGLRQRYRG